MQQNHFQNSTTSDPKHGPITRAMKMIPKGTPWWLSFLYGVAAGSVAGGVYGLWLAVADSNVLFIPASHFTTPYNPNTDAQQQPQAGQN